MAANKVICEAADVSGPSDRLVHNPQSAHVPPPSNTARAAAKAQQSSWENYWFFHHFDRFSGVLSPLAVRAHPASWSTAQ